MEIFIAPPLNWREVHGDDWTEVARLQAQLDTLDDPIGNLAQDLLISWDPQISRGVAVGGWDDYGSLLAYGWNALVAQEPPTFQILGGVHPTHRYKGIGGRLLDWQLARAIAWRDAKAPGQQLRLICTVEGQPGLESLLHERGFVVTRYLVDMVRGLEPLPHAPHPEGVTFEQYTPERGQEVLALHRVCFEAPFSEERWAESLDANEFRPEWSVVALRDDRVVGYCLNGVLPEMDAGADQGWCDRLGVAPEERRHGIAEAMLVRSMKAMTSDGCTSCGISVDVQERRVAAWLTRALGYEASDSVVTMERIVA